MKAKELPSQEELRALFDFNTETGRLIWKRNPSQTSQWNGRVAGKNAGSKNHGYWQVKIGREQCRAHRIIWKIAYGSIPNDMQIDHINGDGLDNRLENLRLVTNSQNQLNRNADKGRKFKGVYKTPQGFKVEITHEGKRIYAGIFKCDQKAALEYDKKAKELHGEYAKLNFPNVEALAV